jgi:hypothetical protein
MYVLYGSWFVTPDISTSVIYVTGLSLDQYPVVEPMQLSFVLFICCFSFEVRTSRLADDIGMFF